MNRKLYIQDDVVGLFEYNDSEDDRESYDCWKDADTQRNFNFIRSESFDEYCSGPPTSRFVATIIRLSDNARIGSIFVSPPDSPPDLAIIIFRDYRYMGYGTRAFALGAKYCFETLGLERIYAGCYEHNTASRAMLKKCGFVPHPEGNVSEISKFTGEEIIQYDYVLLDKNFGGEK